jgi:hypothetical protein
VKRSKAAARLGPDGGAAGVSREDEPLHKQLMTEAKFLAGN